MSHLLEIPFITIFIICLRDEPIRPRVLVPGTKTMSYIFKNEPYAVGISNLN